MQKFILKPRRTVAVKAVNDNRHDQFMWDFMHTWLDFWLDQQNIRREDWPYNRSIHYMYELKNRPWVDDSIRSTDVVRWMHEEAKALGLNVRFLNTDDVDTVFGR